MGVNHKPGHGDENREKLEQLARSRQMQQLMAMLERQGGVQQAAKAAAAGDPSALVKMLEGLTGTPEGANLLGQMEQQVKKAGLS